MTDWIKTHWKPYAAVLLALAIVAMQQYGVPTETIMLVSAVAAAIGVPAVYHAPGGKGPDEPPSDGGLGDPLPPDDVPPGVATFPRLAIAQDGRVWSAVHEPLPD